MAITPPYIKLSNGDVITFERAGPLTTAVLSNSEGVVIRKGKRTLTPDDRLIASEIINDYYFQE